jgi:hypothetical protein
MVEQARNLQYVGLEPESLPVVARDEVGDDQRTSFP